VLSLCPGMCFSCWCSPFVDVDCRLVCGMVCTVLTRPRTNSSSNKDQSWWVVCSPVLRAVSHFCRAWLYRRRASALCVLGGALVSAVDAAFLSTVMCQEMAL